jgi:hypothetical protein
LSAMIGSSGFCSAAVHQKCRVETTGAVGAIAEPLKP